MAASGRRITSSTSSSSPSGRRRGGRRATAALSATAVLAATAVLFLALSSSSSRITGVAQAQQFAGKWASRAGWRGETTDGTRSEKKTRFSFGSKKKKKQKGSDCDDDCDDGKFELPSILRNRAAFSVFAVLVSLVMSVLPWKKKKARSAGRGGVGVEELMCDDPAASVGETTRGEFFEPLEVGFEDVGMTLTVKKGKGGKRVILDGSLRGKASPGRMLAIMGPSGSGKTTLLNALAGKVKANSNIELSGKRYINGSPLTGDAMIPAAFVEQEVNFFPHMTVKETLDFRVELKLASTLRSKKDRDALVQDLMDQLSLTKSADTKVGNSKIRGLSGGERKRLTIACEMISSPSVIFLDEPTSGLDSFQAKQVVETLRRLADKGKTIISVIHQPSHHTFQLFDDLLLVSEGRLMYFGEVSEVRGYMTDLGYGCAEEVGTAEHVLDCISTVVGDSDGESESLKRINTIALAAVRRSRETVVFDGNANRTDDTGGGRGAAVVESEAEKRGGRRKKCIVDQISAHPGANIFRQFKLLLKRSLQDIFRGKAAMIIKVVQQVSIAVIYGGIYNLGDNQASIMDRFGLLSLIAIGATNMAMAGTIRAFPKEKAIVSDEMSSRMYRTLPYFIAKAVSEIPLIGLFNGLFSAIIYPMTNLQKGKFKTFFGITSLHSIASMAAGLLIGSVSPNLDVALALFPPIVVLNIIFDGKNISEENTPYLLRWIPKLGLVRWGFVGLSLNEFDGLEFDTSGPRRGPVARTGEEALARFGLDGKSIGDVVGAQLKLIAGCWVLSYLGLALTRQKFEVMKIPK